MSVSFSDTNLHYSLQKKQEKRGEEPGNAPPPPCPCLGACLARETQGLWKLWWRLWEEIACSGSRLLSCWRMWWPNYISTIGCKVWRRLWRLCYKKQWGWSKLRRRHSWELQGKTWSPMIKCNVFWCFICHIWTTFKESWIIFPIPSEPLKLRHGWTNHSC